jgi:MATE family multidrug resistance protein
VRAYAREYLIFAALTPFFGAMAFAFDGIYTGAIWTKPMRDLMIVAFAIYGVILLTAGSLGNTTLWIALLVFLSARGIGQALLYPRLAKKTFASLT